jgi:hypothetical protein
MTTDIIHKSVVEATRTELLAAMALCRKLTTAHAKGQCPHELVAKARRVVQNAQYKFDDAIREQFCLRNPTMVR